MSNIWLTADWHLGETRFELMGRPFETSTEMIQCLIDNHNNVVRPKDTVIVNGDVCYQKTPEALPIVEKFNGRKILIRGNHDKVFTDEQLKPYFEQIIPEGEGIEMTFAGVPCYVTHYPTQGRFDKFNLVGHIHAAWKYQLNMLNIGVDVHSFRPVDSFKIPFHFKAICEYYDNDVWIAYNNINSGHVGFRGKKGSYFTPVKSGSA
jgi:calcineurin-like phosphoesterase family protein